MTIFCRLCIFCCMRACILQERCSSNHSCFSVMGLLLLVSATRFSYYHCSTLVILWCSTFDLLYFVFLSLHFPTGAKLSVEVAEGQINKSNIKSFEVPCHITQQSSDEAQYQVTWFWQKDAEAKRPIFTAYRNSTLQAGFRKGALRFDRPLQNKFILTVLEPGPADSGLYFCEVEEWLYSLSLGWRNVSTKKSGNLNVTVHTEGTHLSLWNISLSS